MKKNTKAAIIRTLVRTCCILPESVQAILGARSSEMTSALRPATLDTRASKADCARRLFGHGLPITLLADLLGQHYSIAYRAVNGW